MIPSLNGIEISVKGATSVLLGVKGLKQLVAVTWLKLGFYFQKSRNYFLIIEQIILDDSKLPIETIGNLLNVKIETQKKKFVVTY